MKHNLLAHFNDFFPSEKFFLVFKRKIRTKRKWNKKRNVLEGFELTFLGFHFILFYFFYVDLNKKGKCMSDYGIKERDARHTKKNIKRTQVTFF